MKTLLMIDWQNNDYRNSDRLHADKAAANCVSLLESWRSSGCELIHVFLEGDFYQSNQWRRQRFKVDIFDNSIMQQFLPLDGEKVVWKTDRSAFFNTALEEILPKRNPVYFAGASTTGCVLATAIHGDALGYDMRFVEDCIFDRSQKRHEIGLEVLKKFGNTINSKDIV